MVCIEVLHNVIVLLFMVCVAVVYIKIVGSQ